MTCCRSAAALPPIHPPTRPSLPLPRHAGTPPEPARDFDSAVPVRVRREPRNSLSNRFRPDPLIRTRWVVAVPGQGAGARWGKAQLQAAVAGMASCQWLEPPVIRTSVLPFPTRPRPCPPTISAMLSLDDDIMLPCSDLERAFARWRAAPTTMLGFFPRLIEGAPQLQFRGEWCVAAGSDGVGWRGVADVHASAWHHAEGRAGVTCSPGAPIQNLPPSTPPNPSTHPSAGTWHSRGATTSSSPEPPSWTPPPRCPRTGRPPSSRRATQVRWGGAAASPVPLRTPCSVAGAPQQACQPCTHTSACPVPPTLPPLPPPVDRLLNGEDLLMNFVLANASVAAGPGAPPAVEFIRPTVSAQPGLQGCRGWLGVAGTQQLHRGPLRPPQQSTPTTLAAPHAAAAGHQQAERRRHLALLVQVFGRHAGRRPGLRRTCAHARGARSSRAAAVPTPSPLRAACRRPPTMQEYLSSFNHTFGGVPLQMHTIQWAPFRCGSAVCVNVCCGGVWPEHGMPVRHGSPPPTLYHVQAALVLQHQLHRLHLPVTRGPAARARFYIAAFTPR